MICTVSVGVAFIFRETTEVRAVRARSNNVHIRTTSWRLRRVAQPNASQHRTWRWQNTGDWRTPYQCLPHEKWVHQCWKTSREAIMSLSDLKGGWQTFYIVRSVKRSLLLFAAHGSSICTSSETRNPAQYMCPILVHEFQRSHTEVS